MPAYFDLKMGFTCNNFCTHCVIEAKKETPDYTTAQIKSIIDSVPRGDTIGFTGGEATIRADFLALAKYAKDTGHSTALQTNGTRFEDMEFAELAVRYIDDVLIALHSSEETIHDDIVAGNGMWKRTVLGIRNLAELGANFSTQTVISKLNMHTLADTYDFIQAIAPGTWMSMTYPHPNGGAWKNRHLVCPSFTELKPHMHKALAKYASLLRTEAIPLCYIYPYHEELGFNFDSQILTTGDEAHGGIDPANATCDLFDEFGRIEDYRLADLSEKRKGPRCKECVFNDKCPGVWKEYVSMYYDQFDLFPIKSLDKEFAHKLPSIIPGTSVPSGQTEAMPEMDPDREGALIISSNIKCPNTCAFCSGGPTNKTTKQILIEVYQHAQYFIDNGYGSLEISGGDPLDMKETPQVVKYLKDHGVQHIVLSTHGRHFADPAIAEEYAAAGVDDVRIPLYGSTPAIHNSVANITAPTEDPASFTEAVLGIQNCHKAGIKVRAQTIVSRQNKDDLENIFLTYLVATDDSIVHYTVAPAFLAEMTPEFAGDWFIPMKDIGEALSRLMNSSFFSQESGRQLNVIDFPYCTIGRYDDRIQNEPEYPDLGDAVCEGGHGAEENASIPQYRIKEHFAECAKCSMKSICGGIPRNEIKMYGTDGLKAIQGE